MGEYGRVLFMRHPRTVFNDTGLLSGHIDVELSEAGVSQAHRAAVALAAWQPDRILCSPLRRCRAIADEAAAALGQDVIVDERLIELMQVLTRVFVDLGADELGAVGDDVAQQDAAVLRMARG